jgi:hypothetical protein
MRVILDGECSQCKYNAILNVKITILGLLERAFVVLERDCNWRQRKVRQVQAAYVDIAQIYP